MYGGSMQLKVNGKEYNCTGSANTILLDSLREIGMKSVKRGCDTANCGLCTVWVDGIPKLSCSLLTMQVQGCEITTLEGVQEEVEIFGNLMAEQGAEQCGFCSPGFIMNVIAMKRENRSWTEEEMNQRLKGNLCRCTGYESQRRALYEYLEVTCKS